MASKAKGLKRPCTLDAPHQEPLNLMQIHALIAQEISKEEPSQKNISGNMHGHLPVLN